MIKLILIIENDDEQCFWINEMPIPEVAEDKLNLIVPDHCLSFYFK